MDPDSVAKVNQAVDSCLDRCAGSLAPPSLLRDLLKELQDTGEYTPVEIATIENAVRRALDSPG
jgi:hypothetical protein